MVTSMLLSQHNRAHARNAYLLDVEHHASLADPRVFENFSEREGLTRERAFGVGARVCAKLGYGAAVGTTRGGFFTDRRLFNRLSDV